MSKGLKQALDSVIKAVEGKTEDDGPRLRKALKLEEQLLEVRKGLAKSQCQGRIERLTKQIAEASGVAVAADREYLEDLKKFYDKYRNRDEWNGVRKNNGVQTAA